MPALLTRLRALVRRERGFTLVELLVTVSIIGVMVSVSVSLMSSIFKSNLRSFQQYDQQTNVQQTAGFFNSRLYTVTDALGIPADGDTTKTNPLSVAGDQLLAKSNGLCYRIFYVERTREIRYATAPDSCTGAAIKPIRGPNEKDADGSWTERVSSDANYDPVLDDPAKSNVLTSNVVPQPPSGAPSGAPNPLKMFAYRNSLGEVISPGPDTRAQSGTSVTHSTWYNDRANASKVAAIDVTMYINPTSATASSAPARYYNTTIWIGQPAGGTGSAPASAPPDSLLVPSAPVVVSRAFGADYQPSTTRPVLVTVTPSITGRQGATGRIRARVSSSATTTPTIAVGDILFRNNNAEENIVGSSITFLVPTGHKYSITTEVIGTAPVSFDMGYVREQKL